MTTLAYLAPQKPSTGFSNEGIQTNAVSLEEPSSATRGTTVFVHIPKTAGSTVRTLLAQNYRLDRTYALDGRPTAVVRLINLPLEARARLKLLHGHFPFGLHEYLPAPCRQFTFLRDPVRRYFSDFFYAIEDPRHNLHAKIKSGEMSILDYARLPETVPYFDNLMTQYLSGGVFRRPSEKDLSDAKRNLTDAFTVFGITERFDESLLLIARAFGWEEPFYVTKNVSRSTVANVPEEAINAALPWLQKDQELYEFATALFAERVRQAGSELERAVASLQRIESLLHKDYDADRHRFYYVRHGAPAELGRLRDDQSIGDDEARVRNFIAASTPTKGPQASVVGNNPKPVVVTDPALREAIRSKIANVDLVSVDVFDTLLLRTTKPEIQRFWEMSERFRMTVDRADLVREDFFIARLEAVRAAYGNVPRTRQSREVMINEIYRLMLAQLEIPTTQSDAFLEEEIAYEVSQLTANRMLAEILKEASLQGVSIIYASDMYLPAAIIDRLLAAAGVDVPFTAGYSSADISLSKRSGELFDWIIERQRVRPDRCLHLGDHPQGDAARPRERGWQSIHTPRSSAWQRLASVRLRLFQSAMWQRGLTV